MIKRCGIQPCILDALARSTMYISLQFKCCPSITRTIGISDSITICFFKGKHVWRDERETIVQCSLSRCGARMGAKPMSMQAMSSVYSPFQGEMKYMHKTWHQKRTCQIICNKLTVQHWQYRRTYGYMESMCYRVSATNYFHLFSTPSFPNYKVYYYFQEIKLFYAWPSFLWKTYQQLGQA